MYSYRTSRYGPLGSVHDALRRKQAIRSNATLFDNRQRQQKNSECRENFFIHRTITSTVSLYQQNQL